MGINSKRQGWCSAANDPRCCFPSSSSSPNAYSLFFCEKRTAASLIVIQPRSPLGNALIEAASDAFVLPSSRRGEVGWFICETRLEESLYGGQKRNCTQACVCRGQPPRWNSPWGCLLQDSSDLGRGVNDGISANAMHHISAAMIAGYQNNIGMTDLLCEKTPTEDQSSLRSRRGDQN